MSFDFFYHRLTFKPKPLSKDVRLDGQTALITGASGGIGLAAAQELATHGVSRLILGARSVEKVQQAKAIIQAESPDCQVEVWAADQESWASMAAFGQRLSQLARLDIAVLNAGVKQLSYVKSPARHEQNVQVNHLGTALLSLLVSDQLHRTAKTTGKPGRLTVTSSSVLFTTNFNESKAPEIMKRLDEPDSFKDGHDRYSVSKLLPTLFVQQLAERVDAKEIIVNGVNPGLCKSNLHRHESGAAARVMNAIGWQAALGGHCLVDAAIQHPDSHGQYLSEQRVRR